MVSHIIGFIPPSFKSQLSMIILVTPGGLSVSDLDVHYKKPTVIKNINTKCQFIVPTVTTHLENMLLGKKEVQINNALSAQFYELEYKHVLTKRHMKKLYFIKPGETKYSYLIRNYT